ncbi:MAG: hypothetical protein V4525_13925 [Pseudomonadota bacterium]
MFRKFVIFFSAAMLLFFSGIGAVFSATVVRSNIDTILFLIPDTAQVTDPKITVWLDAAKEEGLHLQTITDTAFLQLGTNSKQYVGLIIPDQVHMQASDSIITAVDSYVSQGGKLMLVYDAGVLTPQGAFSTPKSRFSKLAGVDYSLYEELRDSTIGMGSITALQSTWRALRVPPGKSMLYPTANAAAADPVHGLTSYYYGFLNYPSFVTRGTYTGQSFITSPSFGLIAGINTYNKGKVLFINTPLGYLKGYGTDGLLLHSFLHYFAVDLIQLPYFSALPLGIAGMVINIHTDCGNSLADIQTLDNAKLWDSGPFSIDFTGGPDCISWGDKGGLNVNGDVTTQKWIKYFISKGHEVGAHGGWIHDYYGENVSEANQKTIIPGTSYTFNDLLTLNKSAVEAVGGKKVREYSAPQGNTPNWSIQWLEDNGVVGYYSLGNTGSAPTHYYNQGKLFQKKIWAHPLTPYGLYATVEEFAENGITPTEASKWTVELVDFAVKQRTSRMIYFHEPGITGSAADGVSYLSVMQNMLTRARQHNASRFRWYTMTQLSDFMTARERTNWSVSLLSDGNLQFSAKADFNITQQTWVWPKSRYAMPISSDNSVSIVDDAINGEWLVRGLMGKTTAVFTIKPLVPLL